MKTEPPYNLTVDFILIDIYIQKLIRENKDMEGYNPIAEELRKEKRRKIQDAVEMIASSTIVDILRNAEELKCDAKELFGATMGVLPQMFAGTMLHNSDSKKYSGIRRR